MKKLMFGVFLVVASSSWSDALEICARDDGAGAPRDGSKIIVRTTCVAGREVSLGTTEDLQELSARNAVESFVDTDGDMTPETLRFTGINLQVVSGSGYTDDNTSTQLGGDGTGELTHLGNLIVGYNEPFSGSYRTGSHNLIVGPYHGYESYGGFAAGIRSRLWGPWASVSGGWGNIAEGEGSSVSGGESNYASGYASSVSGGNDGYATGVFSSITGGYSNYVDYESYSATVTGGSQNQAYENYSAISGGYGNVTYGVNSTVSGGGDNYAIGDMASVSGGYGGYARGFSSSISGGYSNETTGDQSAICGGSYGTASGSYSSIAGGYGGVASGLRSAVGGGAGVTSAGDDEWHAGQSLGFPAGGQY